MKERTQLKQQNQTFQLSVNRHHRDKTVGNPKHYRDGFKTKELTINGLAQAVKRGHAWSCATYDHSMRSKANYQQAQLIGLDIDNGLTLNDALNHPFVKQYGQLIYTSASHQKSKGDTPPCDRFRIVFSANQPIKDIDSYEQLVKAVLGHFGEADEACKDASRYWAGNSQAEIFILDGDPLPASLIDSAKAQAKIEWEAREKRRIETLARVNEQNPDEVKSLALEALNFIPPRQPGTGTYEESLRVLMALTTIFGPTEAIAIAEGWSPPMKGWNPARKIQGFRVGEVTAGTLFWIAQQHGFKFPERQRHSEGCSPIEPDADQYQAYLEWEIEQDEIEQAIATEGFINSLKAKLLNLSHSLKGFGLNTKKAQKTQVTPPKKLAIKPGDALPTPKNYEGKQPPIMTFPKGHRHQLIWQLKNLGWTTILDSTATGLGKSHDAGVFKNPHGKTWYVDINHRNVSTPTVEENYTDINPRHLGIYNDGHGFKLQGINQIEPSNCHLSKSFLTFKNKNYDIENDPTNNAPNPLCASCIYHQMKDTLEDGQTIAKCASSSGDGYGFRNQRLKALDEELLRLHPYQFPDVDYLEDGTSNYHNDVAFIEEASRTLNPTLITGKLTDFDRTLMDLQLKDPEIYEVLKPLLNLRPYLTGDEKVRHGLNHFQILEKLGKPPENLGEIIDCLSQLLPNIKDLLVKADTTGTIDYKKLNISQTIAKTARAGFKRQAYAKTLENLQDLPNNWLIDFLEVWNGVQGALSLSKGSFTITKPDERTAEILREMGLTVLLDATGNKRALAANLGINSNSIIEIREDTPIYNNLTVKAVETEGMGSNNWSENAIERIKAIMAKLSSLHDDINFYALQDYIKVLDIEHYWFNHNRGGNHDLRREAIASFGKPYINMGTAMAEYVCLFNPEFDDEGKPVGFDEYYQELAQAEYIQLIGRPRAHLYPDQQFTIYLVGTKLDLAFLEEMGINVLYQDEFDYIPDMVKRRKRDKWAVYKYGLQLVATGQKITQKALAQGTGLSQGWICKLFKGANTLSWKDFCKIFQFLYKDHIGTGIITPDTVENATIREWLELQPLELAQEMIKAIHNDGWQTVVDYLRYVCPHEAFQILGILALFTPNSDQVWLEFLPEPPF